MNAITPTTERFQQKISQSRKTNNKFLFASNLSTLNAHANTMDSTFQSINDIHSNNTTAYFNNNTADNPDVGLSFKIYQLNVEGISADKCRYLEKQCAELKADAILLQETHLAQEAERSNIVGYTMVASQHHRQFGIATYVKDNLLPLVQVLVPENDFYTIIKVDEQIIVNVYKPPSMEFGTHVLPNFDKPSFVGGDFNSHNPLWGYNDTNQDGLKVADWMIREDLTLLFNSTDPGTFRSTRWNRSSTPDLCFVSKNADGSIQPATRRILRGFPNSQHRPIVVEIGLKMPLVRADKRNRWNFNKADWNKFAQIIVQTISRPKHLHTTVSLA